VKAEGISKSVLNEETGQDAALKNVMLADENDGAR
jgi:hypothetical protein